MEKNKQICNGNVGLFHKMNTLEHFGLALLKWKQRPKEGVSTKRNVKETRLEQEKRNKGTRIHLSNAIQVFHG